MSTLVEALRTARAKGERPSAPRADLYGADLRGADLRGADLYGAHLRGADLYGADLYGADLRGANLYGAHLRGADLRGAGIVSLGETPSGSALIFPTCDGWVVQIGCWRGSPSDLRHMIAQDDGWPEARGEEVVRRRPYLEAILTHVDLIVAEKADLIGRLAEKWGAA